MIWCNLSWIWCGIVGKKNPAHKWLFVYIICEGKKSAPINHLMASGMSIVLVMLFFFLAMAIRLHSHLLLAVVNRRHQWCWCCYHFSLTYERVHIGWLWYVFMFHKQYDSYTFEIVFMRVSLNAPRTWTKHSHQIFSISCMHTSTHSVSIGTQFEF